MVEVREQAVEGGEVELSCLVPRSRPVAVLRWYRDRKELKGITPESGVRGGRGGASEGRDLEGHARNVQRLNAVTGERTWSGGGRSFGKRNAGLRA